MKLDLFLNFFILLPLAGFLISLLLPSKLEKINSRFAYFIIGAHWIGLLAFLGIWFFQGRPVLNIKDFVLFSTPGYEFFVDFYFDEISAVYLFVGAGLTFLVTIYSRYYLHRNQDENGSCADLIAADTRIIKETTTPNKVCDCS